MKKKKTWSQSKDNWQTEKIFAADITKEQYYYSNKLWPIEKSEYKTVRI